MIQRIQSILLLLGGLCFVDIFFFQSALAQDGMPWLPWVAMVLHGLTALGAIATIFLYSDRKKQLQFATIVQYLAILAIAASLASIYFSGSINEVPANTGATAVLVLPILGYILIRIAGSRIRKDIELVRSMDRLR